MVNWQGKTRARRSAPPRIGRLTAGVFADLAKRTRYIDPAIADHWLTIAGPEIASLCRPGRITGDRRMRSLEVYACSGAAGAQLQFLADDLKQRINQYLGPNAIARIAIKQAAGSAPAATAKRPVKAGAPSGPPSPLDGALASFRRSIGKKDQ